MRSEKGQSPGKVDTMKGIYQTLDYFNNGDPGDTPPAIVYKWCDLANALVVHHTDGWTIDSPFCDMPEKLTTEELVAFCTEELEEIRKAGGC